MSIKVGEHMQLRVPKTMQYEGITYQVSCDYMLDYMTLCIRLICPSPQLTCTIAYTILCV